MRPRSQRPIGLLLDTSPPPDFCRTLAHDVAQRTKGAIVESWVCDYCGQTGVTDPGETTDQVLCHICGELVTPEGP